MFGVKVSVYIYTKMYWHPNLQIQVMRSEIHKPFVLSKNFKFNEVKVISEINKIHQFINAVTASKSGTCQFVLE